MPTRFALRVLTLTLVSALLPLSLAYATHNPTVEQVVAIAESGGAMDCQPVGATQQCVSLLDNYPKRFAVFAPVAGPLSSVGTSVDAYSNGAHDLWGDDAKWMETLHQVGCLDSAAVASFISEMAVKLGPSNGGTVGPSPVGECTMIGSLVNDGALFPHWYWDVRSTVSAGAFPTPTPPPPPTPAPTPPLVVTPPPTATASPTQNPSPAPTPSATPTPSPTPTPRQSRTPGPSGSATPEQTVAGITFAPEPSAAAPDVVEDSIPWAASVHGPADVSTEPAAIGASAAMAMLLLVFMGFVGELFNNTVKANYDELIGWWQKSWPGRMTAAWGRLWRPRP